MNVELYYNNQKISDITVLPSNTIAQIKMLIYNWLAPQGIINYNIKLIFNNGSELDPIIFNTNTYDNVNFTVQSKLLPGAKLLINHTTVKNLPPDLISMIYEFAEDEELAKLCMLNKDFSTKICNSSFWIKKIINRFGLTPEEIIKNKGNNTAWAYYDHLKKLEILSEQRFKDILAKPSIATDLIGGEQYDAVDLYDLLYNTGGDHDWGVIRYRHNYNKNDPIIKEFLEFSEFKDAIDEDNIKTRRALLEEIKNGEYRVKKLYKTFDEWIHSLSTLESRLQDYIIKNTKEDVKAEIKKYQSNIGDEDLKPALYDDAQIEALQILHEAIRNKKLSIFDPVDYESISKKI